jgi:hypothetical protein
LIGLEGGDIIGEGGNASDIVTGPAE